MASKVLPTSAVPEVERFLNAEKDFREFLESNPDFYARLTALVTTRNELLESADKAVRAADATCGPFIKLSESQKILVEKLYEELGQDAFLQVGGYTETITDYKVDRKRFLTEVERGGVPQEIVDICVRKEVRFKKPDAYVLP